MAERLMCVYTKKPRGSRDGFKVTLTEKNHIAELSMLNHNLLTQRKEAGCLCVVCRIVPLLMTILEILVIWAEKELRTVNAKYLSSEDQQVVFM